MKLADVSIKRPVFATVMVSVLAVFGVWGYLQLPIDMFPEVEFPIVTVTAVYPGADPEIVESRVIDKLEEAISAVNGIKMLRSTSMESVGFVVIQFELERKADQAAQDVRDKVSAILRELPSDLDPPVVDRLDFGAVPILAVALSSDMPKRELTQIARDKGLSSLSYDQSCIPSRTPWTLKQAEELLIEVNRGRAGCPRRIAPPRAGGRRRRIHADGADRGGARVGHYGCHGRAPRRQHRFAGRLGRARGGLRPSVRPEPGHHHTGPGHRDLQRQRPLLHGI